MLAQQFVVKPTVIAGLLEIDLALIPDERGWFQEKFQSQKLKALGLPPDFTPVQQNISFNKQTGVTRGLHAEPWDKYVSVIQGRVYSAFVDLRKSNFGQTICITIDPNKAVFVPRGVANSYQTLEDNTYYSYLVNDFWSPDKVALYKFVNLFDPDLNIAWPIPADKSIVSDKDKYHPKLKDIQPFNL